MRTLEEIIDMCRVAPGKKFRLADHDPAWAGEHPHSKKDRKELAKQILSQNLASLTEAQERLYASDTWSVLIVLQSMDAGGKDSIIKHVMSGVNPQGVDVTSFKEPTRDELRHVFLWRCARVLPARGQIGIFNRSYYEDVLVPHVHPELIEAARIPGVKAGPKLWQARYDDINAFERHLARNGTCVLKFFLNLSNAEQRRRFKERLKNPAKLWKFAASDLKERAFWDDYLKAYQEAIQETSTKWAPWHIIPADHKWVARALVASILTAAIDKLKVDYPEVSEAQRAEINKARKSLKNK